MSVLELRSELIELVSTVQEENVLLKLRNTFKKIVADEKEYWDEFSPELQAELDIAIKESEDPSNHVAHEDALKLIDQWLKE